MTDYFDHPVVPASDYTSGGGGPLLWSTEETCEKCGSIHGAGMGSVNEASGEIRWGGTVIVNVIIG